MLLLISSVIDRPELFSGMVNLGNFSLFTSSCKLYPREWFKKNPSNMNDRSSIDEIHLKNAEKRENVMQAIIEDPKNLSCRDSD